MVKIRLSSIRELIPAAFSLTAVTAVSVLLAVSLRKNTAAMLLVTAAALVLIFLFCFYAVSVFRAACIVSNGSPIIQVRAVPDQSLDISGAVKICTKEVNVGNIVTRNIVFLDSGGSTVCSLTSFFTAKRGAGSEAAAQRLAEVLGLEFIPMNSGDSAVSDDLTDYDAMDDER